jgi:hypothetical protein
MNAPRLDLRKIVVIASLAVLLVLGAGASLIKWRGFRASSKPSAFETAVARSLRNFAIPALNGARLILSLAIPLRSSGVVKTTSRAARPVMEWMLTG